MKKLLIATLILFPSLALASFDVNLRFGTHGNSVTELQDLLVDEGCLNVSPTGYFGLLTVKGVKCFQTKNNLPSTGYFGPMSREVANTIILGANKEADTAEQSETGSTTNPSGITLEQSLLQQQIKAQAELQAQQLQALKEQNERLQSKVNEIAQNIAPVQPAPIVTEPVKPVEPVCEEHPVLTFDTDKKVVPLEDLTPGESQRKVMFTGTYTTGCPLDPSTKWSLRMDDPELQTKNDGTLKQNRMWWSTWTLEGNYPGKEIYDRATFSGFSLFYKTTNVTMTVGSTTATTVITAQ